MLELANQIRRKKAMENKWQLYEFINKTPNLTVYELSKKIEWSIGKTDYYIKKLIKDGLVLNSTEIIKGRLHNFYTPKKIKEMINWKEIKNL